MRTQEVMDFLESLQWARMTKKELEKKLQDFFGVSNTLEDFTVEDCKDIDYSYGFTSQIDNDMSMSVDFYDVEIWYLKMRNRHILITGTEILACPV